MRSRINTATVSGRNVGLVAVLALLMVAAPAGATAVTLSGNTITITGNDALNDAIAVTTDGTNVDISVNGDAATYADFALVTSVTLVKIYGLGGNDTLDCSGLPVGIRCEIYGSDGNDTITGGPDADTLDGGNGDDSVTGGAGADTIHGNADDDTLDGGSDNDTVYGDDGDDTITGNTGNDTLNGGAGDDAITGAGGTDTVTYSDATASVTVDLSNAGAQATGGAGTDTLATIENLTGSAYADTLTGDGNANTISGGAEDDTIDGAGGNDVLNGDAGDDTIDGGAGTDTISGGEGDDTLNGDAGADTITGGDGNDDIDGGADGDTIDGGTGNDSLIGGLGDDSITGGTGTDTLDYSGAAGAVTVNLSTTGSAQNTVNDGSDTLVDSIENLTGTGNGDTLTGNSSANVIDGGAGNDAITGGSGNDTITGGAGTDTLTGGDGNDTISGDAGNDTIDGSAGDDTLSGGADDDSITGGTGTDTVSYDDASAAVTVDLSDSGAQATGGAGSDTLATIENLTGSDYNDTLTGDENANTISGGTGNDTIEGGLGNDTLDGGAGTDTLTFANAAGGIEVSFMTGTAYGAGTDSVTNFENLVGSAQGDILTGSAGDNVISGGAGNDVINGRGGDDTLDGGANTDIADYRNGSAATVDVDISGGTAEDGEGGTDSLANFEDEYLPASGALTATAGADKNVVKGSGVKLDGSGSGGVGTLTYAWTPTTGLSASNIAQPTASPTTTTTYTLTVEDGNGLTASDTVIVTVVDVISSSAGSDKTIVTGGSTTLQGAVTGGLAPFVYAWTPTVGLGLSNVAQPTAFPTVTTTYTLTVTDALGQTATDTVIVNVNPALTVNAGADQTITLGQTAMLQGVASGGIPPYTFQWSPPTDLNATNIANPVSTPTRTMNYTFRVTDSALNSAADVVKVTVNGSADTGNDGDNGNDGDQDPTPAPLFPWCGTGAAQTVVLTGFGLMLMGLRRRR